MGVIYLTEERFDNRIKTIATKNLKKYGSALTWVSLSHYFNECILCVHDDGKVLEIDEDRYKELRVRVMSKEFNCREETKEG